MNDNYLDEDINRKRGRILSLFPIYANILAIASFFFGVTMVNNTNITFILLLSPGFILPVVAFVISIIIMPKTKEDGSPIVEEKKLKPKKIKKYKPKKQKKPFISDKEWNELDEEDEEEMYIVED